MVAQRTFFATGKTKNVDFRLDALRRLQRAVHESGEAICEALWLDLHKSKQESFLTEISVVLAEISLHVKHLKRWAAPHTVATPLFLFGSRSSTQAEPYGIALILAPWNYPFQLLLAPLVGALSAGNCAILKPSPRTPNTNRVVTTLLASLFPTEYVALVEGGAEQAQELLSLKPDMIFFTGAPQLGRVVMEAAARDLIPVTLELGGKSPCVVAAEANIDLTARRIAWGKFLNAGQTCVAPDYVLVDRRVVGALTERLIHYIKQFHGPDPKQSTYYGRMIGPEATLRMQGYLQDADFELLHGGEADAAERYMAPTLLLSRKSLSSWLSNTLSSAMLTEEIFGPLLPILPYDQPEEAIAYINRGEKPLALYFFGPEKCAKQIIASTSSGGVCINDVVMHLANAHLPFGGVGQSGMGNYHGRHSFETFSHTRAILRSPVLFDFPFRYPPYKGFAWVKRMFR